MEDVFGVERMRRPLDAYERRRRAPAPCDSHRIGRNNYHCPPSLSSVSWPSRKEVHDSADSDRTRLSQSPKMVSKPMSPSRARIGAGRSEVDG